MNSSPNNNFWASINRAFLEEQIFPDLKVILFWLFISLIAIYFPFLNNSPVRTILVIPIILIIPGYSLITAFFPEKEDLELIERMAISIGLSMVIIPLIGLGLNYTPWGIRRDPIVISLIFFIICFIFLAQYRRGILDEQDRYQFPFAEIVETIKKEFFFKNLNNTAKYLSIILIFFIILALITSLYIYLIPNENEKFTEFYILGENKMTTDYPTKMFEDQHYRMFIGVGNHEFQNLTYTIEIFLVNMSYNENENITYVNKVAPLNNLTLSLSHNETITLPYELIPNDTGFNRVEFLLFNTNFLEKNMSFKDKKNASYRDLHLWVDVYPAEKR